MFYIWFFTKEQHCVDTCFLAVVKVGNPFLQLINNTTFVAGLMNSQHSSAHYLPHTYTHYNLFTPVYVIDGTA